MEQVGVTIDGKKVMKGIGPLYFREGLPLSIIFDRMAQEDMIPSWNHLYDEMKENGMSHKRIIHLIHEQGFDSFGKEFRDEVIRRLELKKDFITL